jgi:hypothetical protein
MDMPNLWWCDQHGLYRGGVERPCPGADRLVREHKGMWYHCTPSLLSTGLSCEDTPRRACACPTGGVTGHDHLVPDSVRLKKDRYRGKG